MCDIVSIEPEMALPKVSEIKIASREIVVSLPVNASAETNSMVLRTMNGILRKKIRERAQKLFLVFLHKT
jgi:hypothetical protein